MSRKQAPPKPEELIAKLDEKFETFREEITGVIAEKSAEIEQINAKDLEIKQTIEDNRNQGNENLQSARIKLENLLDDKLEVFKSEVSRRIDEISQKIQVASSSSSGTENRIQEMVERIENIQEKMYDFEINKRNNLLFYGIKEDRRETPSELLSKIKCVLRDSFNLKREITISSASRMFSGPDVGGCRPVVVSFEEFKDRDEVLRKAGLLRGSSIHVTEDMSRRVRESRQELRRFMREVRRANPASVCNLQYDTLYVDKKCYKYNPVEGRVVEHTAAPDSHGQTAGGDGRASSLGRSSPYFGSRLGLASKGRSPGLYRTQSCLIGGLAEDQQQVVAEMDQKIRELKSVVSDKDDQLEKLKETVRRLQEKVENSHVETETDIRSNGNADTLNGQEEVLEEVDDNN